MNVLHKIAFVLLAIGGLNWLGVAFGYNVVEMIFKPTATAGLNPIAMVIYILVGLSAIVLIFSHKGTCMVCSGKDSMKSM